jgi:NADPH:quinone reductase
MDKQTFRAVVCEAVGPIEALRVCQLPRRPLGAASVRVALKAAGINFPDLLMVQGLYQHRPALPFVPGLEAAGVVIEVAPDVAGPAVGDSVIVRMPSGAYAQEAIVPVNQATRLPAGFTFEEGATFLAAHTTALHALKTRAKLAAGQTLLVLGAAGGVGLAAVQIASAMGARVLAAASTHAKLATAVQYGADAAINYSTEPIEDAVKRLTGGKGVNVVLDPVGMPSPASLRCLGWNGKLLIAGFAGGTIPAYAANRVLLKGATIMGVRAGEAGRNDPKLRRRELVALLKLAERGLVKPFVSACFPLPACVDALRLLQHRKAIGRIALRMDVDTAQDRA